MASICGDNTPWHQNAVVTMDANMGMEQPYLISAGWLHKEDLCRGIWSHLLGVHWKTDAEAETPVLWPPHEKSWLTGKDADAGRDWGQGEKGTTEDEMAGWHHWLDGHGFEWTPGVGDGQRGLVCCDSWGHKDSDTTERLNWTELRGFRKGRGTRDQIATSTGSSKKQESSRKISTSHWLCQSLWLCGPQQTLQNSSRYGNTRPPDWPLEKSVCRSGSNS